MLLLNAPFPNHSLFLIQLLKIQSDQGYSAAEEHLPCTCESPGFYNQHHTHAHDLNQNHIISNRIS